MRHLFLAVLGVLAVSGAVSAQQPQYQPARYPASPPAAGAATPLQPVSGATVISGGAGCTNCGTAGRGFTMSKSPGTPGCALGAPCQNGCGSLKSDLSFMFGSCKDFFAPCGPTCSRSHAGRGTFAQPWGTGFGCPRPYDSYANH